MNGQFHLNTSVAPPWGSEVRLNAPPGGLDNPFLGSPGGQTNIFPVTFDQNAAFSLNGPFLSLTNDLESTNVHSFNVTVERQLSGAVVCDRRLHRQPDEQHLGVHPAQQRALHPGPRHQRPAEHRQHQQSPAAQPDRSEQRQVLRAVGPVRERRQPALQRHGADAPRRHPVDDRERQLHAVALLRVPRGRRRPRPRTCRTGYNIPSNPQLRRRQLRGGPSAQLLADRQHPVAAARQPGDARRVLGLAAGGRLPEDHGAVVDGQHRKRHRLERPGRHAAGESGARRSVCGHVDQSGQRRACGS